MLRVAKNYIQVSILGGHTYRYVQACKRWVYWVVKGGSEQFWGDFCALSCSCTLAPNYQLGHFSNLNRADKLQNPQLFPPRWWQTPRFCNNVRICGFLSLESFEAGNLHALWHQRLLSNISRPDWKESILKIPRSISPQLVSTLELASGDCQPFTLTLVLRWSFVRGEDSTLEWGFDECVQDRDTGCKRAVCVVLASALEQVRSRWGRNWVPSSHLSWAFIRYQSKAEHSGTYIWGAAGGSV